MYDYYGNKVTSIPYGTVLKQYKNVKGVIWSCTTTKQLATAEEYLRASKHLLDYGHERALRDILEGHREYVERIEFEVAEEKRKLAYIGIVSDGCRCLII